MTDSESPVVSVIIPARNEEICLGRCLASLASQIDVLFEIIVVDDASTDRTGDIARSFVDSSGPPVTVISAPPLPENWTGKNNAMSDGAERAKGKWLLFTDADTFHKPGSLARAVAEAEKEDVALLSYSPEQEVHTLLEKAVMPVIFAELAATYPPSKVRDPKSPIAAANGQYLMISRETYDAVGGHAKIASDLLEDVAMARLVKSSGRKIWFRYGGDAVRTRMYRSWPQMKEGWTKNLALQFPKVTGLAWLRLWQFICLLILPWSILRGSYWKAAEAASPIPWIRWQYLIFAFFIHMLLVWWAVDFVFRMRKSNAGWRGIVLGFFGLPVFAYFLWRSDRAYKNGRFDWKDRSYVYSAREVNELTHGFSRERTMGIWEKSLYWLRRNLRQ